MGGESPKPGVQPTGAVFLSYASQDAQAAQTICEALRAAGIEVWFDQSELRGGDVWDQTIRKQIKACALFIPVISRQTHERREGYFRLEWRLAVDRANLISATRAFLIPVVIDDTREDDEEVPERIRDVHWTRLPAGETSLAFVERVQRLLSGEASSTIPAGAASRALPAMGGGTAPFGWPRRLLSLATAVAALVVVTCLAIYRPWISKPEGPALTSAAAPASADLAAFNPPPHSIAVLPFVNMSGDKEQEYFSEGLTEELLNALSRINELQVAARTSSFSFEGQHPDIATIAHKLNVGAVLEGSVRRSERTVRVTAQLVNAVTGFHLWSKTYDRDLGDVLKLQTEIATAVADSLKVTLLGDIARKIELGGTRNPAAFDAYLRASKAVQSRRDAHDLPNAIAAYTEAIRLDPDFALAFAGRSLALNQYAAEGVAGPAVHESFEKAESDARRAIALAPDLAEAHLALAQFLDRGSFDFAGANEEYERALALAPGNAEVLRASARFARLVGHVDDAITAARRAVVLDPLDHRSHMALGGALYNARRYGDAVTAYSDAISLSPDFKPSYGRRGWAFYGLGDLASARASCEMARDNWESQFCLAVVYDKLGRHADAEAELKKFQATLGDASAYQYATIYAQWGNHAKALEWLATAMRVRDPGLIGLKTDPRMDPLRPEPRFQSVVRELKFPD